LKSWALKSLLTKCFIYVYNFQDWYENTFISIFYCNICNYYLYKYSTTNTVGFGSLIIGQVRPRIGLFKKISPNKGTLFLAVILF
jgi:hypothetical protein